MMVCTNELTAATVRPLTAIRALLQVLNPFAPHLTEELNETLDAKFPGAQTGLLAGRPWPEYNPAFLVEDEIEIPIQINGKLRERIVVKKDAVRQRRSSPSPWPTPRYRNTSPAKRRAR